MTDARLSKDQIFAILNRIRFLLEQQDILPEPTPETLREIQYRFVTSIPFETLSLRLTQERAVDISLEGIFDRVVNKHRGGWCFSLNCLLYNLLKEIGFAAQPTVGRMCKPLKYGDPIVFGGMTHRVTIVKFHDGSKYVTDVGFG